MQPAGVVGRYATTDRRGGFLLGEAAGRDGLVARERLEGAAEPFAGPEEQGLGGLGRHSHHGRRLAVRQAVDVVQQKDRQVASLRPSEAWPKRRARSLC